jgi:hypothetical protein
MYHKKEVVMKYYVEFLEKRSYTFDEKNMRHVDCKPYLTTPVGSDSVCILDGRLSLENMINAAIDQKKNLKKVQPHYNGFRIRKGERFSDDNPILYTYNPLNLKIK